jgi:hypothetical protein
MAAIVVDYTALELLKQVARQDLYDFHKVYLQVKAATDKVRGFVLLPLS